MPPTTLVPPELAADITAALAQLRALRVAHPQHCPEECAGCDVCGSEARLNYLLERLAAQVQPTESQPT